MPHASLIKPINRRLIGRVVTGPLMSSGGIHLPERQKLSGKATKEVEIITLADDVPLDLKAGDHVLTGLHAGTLTPIGGDECLLLVPQEILARIEH